MLDSRFAPVLGVLLVVQAAACLGAAPASAAALRLGAGQVSGTTVSALDVSPDGRYAVYAQTVLPGLGRELWSVPVTGGPDPELLSPVVGPNDAVTRLAVSPDSQRVVYRALQEAGGMPHLWSVPILGGPTARLAPVSIPAGSAVSDGGWQISPDGSRVVFIADYLVLGRFELWSAPVDGSSQPVRISGTLVSGGDVASFRIRPSGTHVLYRADQDIDNVYELFRVPIAGGTVAKLNPSLPAGRSVTSYALSPSGSRVVYIADQVSNDVFELFHVTFLGGASTKLNPTPVTGGDVESLEITGDSDFVVYRGDLVVDGRAELFSVPITGGTALRLHAPLQASQSVGFGVLAPAGHAVVYQLDLGAGATPRYRFHRADVRTGLPSVEALWPGGRDHSLAQLAISRDGHWVFYRTDEPLGFRLYASPLVGDVRPPHLVSAPTIADGYVGQYLAVHPDDRQVLFVGDLDGSGPRDVHVGDLCLLCDGFESGDFRRWPVAP